MIFSDLLQIGEVCDHRRLLAAEGQVDKVPDVSQVELFRHCLKLRPLITPEAVQPLRQIVQLIHIDRLPFQPLENGIAVCEFVHLAVLPDRIPDFQGGQHLHGMVIFLSGQRKGNSGDAVLRMGRITEYRVKLHFSLRYPWYWAFRDCSFPLWAHHPT